MIRFLVPVCVGVFAIMQTAQAQPVASKSADDLRAAGQAAVDYAKAIPDPYISLAYDTSRTLNSPSDLTNNWIADARADIAKATQALASLKMPVSKVKGFDLSFALKRLNSEAKANLAAATQTLDAFEAMRVAQQAGDCVGYAAQNKIYEEASAQVRAYSAFQDHRDLQTFLERYAGGQPPEKLQQVQVAPPTNAIRMRYLANDFAALLRCPLPAGAFDIDVSISMLASANAYSKMYADVHVTSSMEASQRAAIEARLNNFLVPNPSRFARWTDAKQPLKFHWDGQVLTAVIE